VLQSFRRRLGRQSWPQIPSTDATITNRLSPFQNVLGPILQALGSGDYSVSVEGEVLSHAILLIVSVRSIK